MHAVEACSGQTSSRWILSIFRLIGNQLIQQMLVCLTTGLEHG